jgi:hypothetical protein
MLTIEGIYKNGQIVLIDAPTQISEAKVLVTFLDAGQINLTERGIDEERAAELRSKLNTIVQDWNRPEMDVYDVD